MFYHILFNIEHFVPEAVGVILEQTLLRFVEECSGNICESERCIAMSNCVDNALGSTTGTSANLQDIHMRVPVHDLFDDFTYNNVEIRVAASIDIQRFEKVRFSELFKHRQLASDEREKSFAHEHDLFQVGVLFQDNFLLLLYEFRGIVKPFFLEDRMSS